MWATLEPGDLVAAGADQELSEGLIDLLAQSSTAEVAILFRDLGDRTRISVRTRDGGVDAIRADSRVRWGRARPGGRRDRRAAPRSSAGCGAGRRPHVSSTACGPGDGERDAPGGPDGILVVDKPVGPTSHDVVAIVRRLSGVRRVGHGGTLDPFAAGVLPVFLGRATRMVEYHLGDEKAYRAVMVFGARSTTDDLDGELTPTAGPAPSRDAVEAALGALVGSIEQTPPVYSAVRIGGRHAYDLARHGETPSSNHGTVTIHAIDVVDWDVADPDRPAATVELRCSAGTYVRAIARDAGESLGTRRLPGGAGADRQRTVPARATSHPLDEVRERLSVGPRAGAAAAGRLGPGRIPRGARRRGGPDGPRAGPGRSGPGRRRAGSRPVGSGACHVRRRSAGRHGPPGHGSPPPGEGVPRAAGSRRDARTRLSMVRLLDDIDHIPAGLRFVATVGVFDGVHLGHVHVLRALSRLADDRGALPIAVTFEPHPQAVVTGRTPELICDPDEKLARMGEAGAELVVVQHFDEAFRAQTAEEFLERLARGRDLAGLVMSPESAFGRDRQGTVDTVRRLAMRDGWQLVEIDTLEIDGARVSSGRIRELVAAGDLEAAAHLLGRRYAISGQAAASDDGWWTLEPAAPYSVPPAGSYAVTASWGAVGAAPGSARVDGDGRLCVRVASAGDLPGSAPVRVEL